jgi:hypothetical protein
LGRSGRSYSEHMTATFYGKDVNDPRWASDPARKPRPAGPAPITRRQYYRRTDPTRGILPWFKRDGWTGCRRPGGIAAAASRMARSSRALCERPWLAPSLEDARERPSDVVGAVRPASLVRHLLLRQSLRLLINWSSA